MPKEPQDHKPKKAKMKAETVVTYDSVTIAGVHYPLPSLGRMDRAAVKKLKPLIESATSGGGDLESLWDLADALLVETPTEQVDRLNIDDLRTILDASGIIAFTGADAPDPRNVTITLGESSASTGS